MVGIEGIFTTALNTELARKDVKFQSEAPMDRVGVRQFYEGRTKGRVDTFLPNSRTAIESKAVRLPRQKSSPKFDLGQLLADYLRLRSGSLKYAYLVIFVYELASAKPHHQALCTADFTTRCLSTGFSKASRISVTRRDRSRQTTRMESCLG